MKHKMLKKVCGMFVASLAAFAIVACGDDSSSGPSPDNFDEPASSAESDLPGSSANGTIESSANGAPVSSSSVITSSATIESSSSEVESSASDGRYSEEASNPVVDYKSGAAVAPRVMKLINDDGSVSIRDEWAEIMDKEHFAGVHAELGGDTLYATSLYSEGAQDHGFSALVLSFDVSDAFANVKYYKLDSDTNVQTLWEVTKDEFYPSSSSNHSYCDPGDDGCECLPGGGCSVVDGKGY